MAIRTARVGVAEIFALRHAVLLPGRPPAEAEFAEDTAPGAFHLAAYDAQGYGVAVLAAGLTESAARDAHLVWCNARMSAAGFYLKHGFEVRGAEFVIEGVGPHVVMTAELTPGG